MSYLEKILKEIGLTLDEIEGMAIRELMSREKVSFETVVPRCYEVPVLVNYRQVILETVCSFYPHLQYFEFYISDETPEKVRKLLMKPLVIGKRSPKVYELKTDLYFPARQLLEILVKRSSLEYADYQLHVIDGEEVDPLLAEEMGGNFTKENILGSYLQSIDAILVKKKDTDYRGRGFPELEKEDKLYLLVHEALHALIAKNPHFEQARHFIDRYSKERGYTPLQVEEMLVDVIAKEISKKNLI